MEHEDPVGVEVGGLVDTSRSGCRRGILGREEVFPRREEYRGHQARAHHLVGGAAAVRRRDPGARFAHQEVVRLAADAVLLEITLAGKHGGVAVRRHLCPRAVVVDPCHHVTDAVAPGVDGKAVAVGLQRADRGAWHIAVPVIGAGAMGLHRGGLSADAGRGRGGRGSRAEALHARAVACRAGKARRAGQPAIGDGERQDQLARLVQAPARLLGVALLHLRRQRVHEAREQQRHDGEHHRELDQRETSAAHQLVSTTTMRSLKGRLSAAGPARLTVWLSKAAVALPNSR